MPSRSRSCGSPTNGSTLGRAGWRVVYVEDAVAFTEAPATLSALWRQRYRWSYGTMQAVWKHRGALLRKDEGRIGRIGIPYLLLFQVALPLLAPLIDIFTIYGLLFLDPLPVLAYWIGFNAWQSGWPRTPSGSTMSRCVRFGRCRCSRSSIAS